MLRGEPHRVPFGHQPHEQAGLVERLHDRDAGGARVAAPRRSRRARPAATAAASARDSVASRSSVNGASGRSCSAAARAARSVMQRIGPRVGVAREHDLAVLRDDVLRQRRADRPRGRRRRAAGGAARIRRGCPLLPRLAATRCPAPARRRARPRSPTAARHPRRADPSASATADCSCWRSTSSSRPVRRCNSPRASSSARRASRTGDGDVDQLRQRERAQGLHVAQPAARVLQVRLEQERGVARDALAFARQLAQFAGPLRRRRAPRLDEPLAQRPRHRRVTGDVPQFEQPEQGLQVIAGDRDRLRGRADRVVEADPAVPDRVPDRRRQARSGPRPCRCAAARDRGRRTARARAGRRPPTATSATPSAERQAAGQVAQPSS